MPGRSTCNMQYLDRSKFFNKKKKENSDLVFQSKVKKRGHGLYFPLPPYFSKECPGVYTFFLTSTLYSRFSLSLHPSQGQG